MTKLLVFLICLMPLFGAARDGMSSNDGQHRAGELVIKLKPEFRGSYPSILPELKKLFDELGVTKVTPMFPRTSGEPRMPAPMRRVDLSRIYKVVLPGDVLPAVQRLRTCAELEYAEPFYIHELAFTPNDTDLSQQYFPGIIQAFAGWDIWQGDTATVIGIVDSGTDWDHPDLQSNIPLNYGDPVNGIDDDSDGFIDNFRGWDLSENDNDPTVGVQPHGSVVSGCAAAVTDNTTGVAGAGFRCRLLPVKASYDASGSSIDHGYEGIVYAADHGCSVINCSWGRRGGASQFEQDVIDYATFNRGALVVGAAGNHSAETLNFPASYEQVLSVAATDLNDERSGSSNFHFTVDVSAPGEAIYTTRYDNTYTTQSGTSMAAPIAAGTVAIVRSFNPSFTPGQAAARLRATADNIDTVGNNSFFAGKIGKGRINLYRALTDSLTPGVGVSSLQVEDGNDNSFLINDTLRISAVFTNYLHATNALAVTLSTVSPNVVILNNGFPIGVLGTLASDSNRATPFNVRILPGTPLNTAVDLKMTLTDGGYTDSYSFRITVNVDYLNVTVNDVGTSVNSKGRFGYNKQNQVEGLGFTYLGENSLLFSGGLMVGDSPLRVSDAVQGAGATDDDDFTIGMLLTRRTSSIAPFEARGTFSDGGAPGGSMALGVAQTVLAWDNAPHRKYIILKYALHNSGPNVLSGLWAGLYADWDIADYQHNKCSMDLLRKMGYAWSTDTSLYTAMKLLSPTAFNHYAVDNDSSGLGGLDLTDGFTTQEKYTALSTLRADAGVFGQGKDVIDIVSTGPFTLSPGDSIVVAFALIAGDSLASVQHSADQAQRVYDSLLVAISPIGPATSFSFESIYPNPATREATVVFQLDGYGLAEINLFDMTGRKVQQVLSEKLPAGRHNAKVDVAGISRGIYYLRLSFEGRQVIGKLLIW